MPGQARSPTSPWSKSCGGQTEKSAATSWVAAASRIWARSHSVSFGENVLLLELFGQSVPFSVLSTYAARTFDTEKHTPGCQDRDRRVVWHCAQGCRDLEVADCVCAVDAYCCRVAWDVQCTKVGAGVRVRVCVRLYVCARTCWGVREREIRSTD